MRQIVEALEEFPRQRHVAYQSRTPLDEAPLKVESRRKSSKIIEKSTNPLAK